MFETCGSVSRSGSLGGDSVVLSRRVASRSSCRGTHVAAYGTRPLENTPASLRPFPQIATAIFSAVNGLSIWSICVLAYLIGGFAHQSLFFAVHEIGHNLVFKAPILNRYVGVRPVRKGGSEGRR